MQASCAAGELIANKPKPYSKGDFVKELLEPDKVQMFQSVSLSWSQINPLSSRLKLLLREHQTNCQKNKPRSVVCLHFSVTNTTSHLVAQRCRFVLQLSITPLGNQNWYERFPETFTNINRSGNATLSLVMGGETRCRPIYLFPFISSSRMNCMYTCHAQCDGWCFIRCVPSMILWIFYNRYRIIMTWSFSPQCIMVHLIPVPPVTHRSIFEQDVQQYMCVCEASYLCGAAH